MDVIFKSLDLQEILAKVNQNLRKSPLNKMVHLTLDENQLIMTVSKLGKSRIYMEVLQWESETRFTVKREDIRPQHKPLRPFVVDSICNVLEQSGGTVKDR